MYEYLDLVRDVCSKGVDVFWLLAGPLLWALFGVHEHE